MERVKSQKALPSTTSPNTNPNPKVKKSEEEIIAEALTNPLQTVKTLIKNNLFYFIQYFWSEYSSEQFIPNWHIEEVICPELERVARNIAAGKRKEHDLIINVPPGTTKTATVSIFFPLWCWVNWNWMRVIAASYTYPLALESAEYSRDIIRSDKWKEIFPEVGIKEDKDTKSNFRTFLHEWVTPGYPPRRRLGGNRFSTSVGGSVTGFHGHLLIVDDPIDPNGVLSDKMLKKTNLWISNTLSSRKVDKKTATMIVVMQRLHQNDPTGYLLKVNKEGVKHICLPGEIKNYQNKVSPPELVKYYSEEGLLDENRLDWESLNEFLKHGQYTYGSQIGQDPVPLGGGMFKTDHLAVLPYMPEHYLIDEQIRYWDKAGTEGGDGAYTVGVKMLRMKDKSFVVADVKRGRWSSEERERIIKETAVADGTKCKIAIEQEPGSGGKESAEATVKNLAGYATYKDRPVGDKVHRADPFSVQVNLGNVKLVAAAWNEVYIDELKNFPNSTFKDQTDASSGAFAQLTSLKKASVGRNS